MNNLISAFFTRARTTMLALLLILIAGTIALLTIPKESFPDVAIPYIYVSLTHEGISPEDAERLLARPMEKELGQIEGVKEMTSTSSEGHASILLEFDAGFNSEQAVLDVREKVDRVKSELPSDTDEPTVNEVNVSLFPILTITLSGPMMERELITIAGRLKDQIETLPGILEVDIAGDREEMMEILIEPLKVSSYKLNWDEVLNVFNRNNVLVAAGALDTGSGRSVLKVPGVIEGFDDIASMPIKSDGNTVVRFDDIARVQRSYKDRQGYARIDGQSAVTLNIVKRTGSNIIEVVESVRGLVSEAQKTFPEELQVGYLQDQSDQIKVMLGDLQNNVLFAVLLVVLVILIALGPGSAFLAGMAIPTSFLAGILAIYSMGLTLNIVVLFSLILVVGMLVDGAIVVVELASRRMAEGASSFKAYQYAAQRMAWPIIASTATTLAVFIPMLPWPGVTGEFMKYLPITVILTLTASLLTALVFIPILGGITGYLWGNNSKVTKGELTDELKTEQVGWFTNQYIFLLKKFLQKPGLSVLGAIALLFGVIILYGKAGHGIEFFPSTEPDRAVVLVQTRGDLSIEEKDEIVREVEKSIIGEQGVMVTYTQVFSAPSGGSSLTEDTIAQITLEYADWKERPKSKDIIESLNAKTGNIPGVVVEYQEQEGGPGGGKPIGLQFLVFDEQAANEAVDQVIETMRSLGGFTDIEDDRSLPGVEWRLLVDRALAAQYDADILSIGSTVQMLTNGVRVGGYRPSDADDELDIRVRFDEEHRHLSQIDQLVITTSQGTVPLSNFLTLEPAYKIGTLKRANGWRAITLQADLEAGYQTTERLRALFAQIESDGFPDGVQLIIKGEAEDQQETMVFLVKAFGLAIFLMTIILVTQFNSFYQTFTVLSAIIFSSAGLFLSLLIRGQPFGIVMSGLGMIALAGIVVNNNIVLIDTLNSLRKQGLSMIDAMIETCSQRFRPIMLTTITTILGLVPMAIGMSINILGRELDFGAPSTQMWTQLASSIAGGLSFATLLTLFITPSMLILGDKISSHFSNKRKENSNNLDTDLLAEKN